MAQDHRKKKTIGHPLHLHDPISIVAADVGQLRVPMEKRLHPVFPVTGNRTGLTSGRQETQPKRWSMLSRSSNRVLVRQPCPAAVGHGPLFALVGLDLDQRMTRWPFPPGCCSLLDAGWVDRARWPTACRGAGQGKEGRPGRVRSGQGKQGKTGQGTARQSNGAAGRE